MDYFAILDVKVDATPEEIKRAYRKKARQFHPDVNDAPGTEDQFRLVTEAYHVLSDAKQRAAYVQTRIQAAALDKRITRRKPRKQPKSSDVILHIGYLLIGLFMLMIVLERGAFYVSGARSSVQAQCTALSWQPLAGGDRSRLTYAATLPDQSTRVEGSAIVNGIPVAYTADSFVCYYIESISALRLDSYGINDILSLLPWGAVGAFLTLHSGRFFFR